MKRKLSLTLAVIMIFSLSACRKTGGLSSDIESDLLTSTNQSISGTENANDSSEEENSEIEDNSDNNQTNTVTDSSSPSSAVQSTVDSTAPQTPAESSKTPVQNDTTIPEIRARQKMTGTWRFTIPENTLPSDGFIYEGYRLVYDLTISEGSDIFLSEKQFLRSDTETVGAVEYFDGKRYTLMYDSLVLIQGSFSGEISILPENEKTAILDLSGYETRTGRFYIEEEHYLTLIDDSHLRWTKAELHSEWFDEQYFPWDSSTVFTRK